jgi:hypothetical protein
VEDAFAADTSAGNRQPANADRDAGNGRGRVESLTSPSCRSTIDECIGTILDGSWKPPVIRKVK